MDPGEQITGTRDENYDLISVLYHALQGAENCTTYALDAEAAGEEQLTAFFREAGVAQTRLAEKAKDILGLLEVPPGPVITPEGPAPSVGAPPPEAAGPPPDAPELPPVGPPTVGAVSDPDLVLPEEDVVAAPDEGAAPLEDPAAETPEADRMVPEDLDPTIMTLKEGVLALDPSRAVAEVESWELRLEASGEPELQAIAANLGALRALLSEDDIDARAAGPLLSTLGEQVRGVATSGAPGFLVAEKLERLGELLQSEGRSLSG